jgi:inorganic pyrophosphatase
VNCALVIQAAMTAVIAMIGTEENAWKVLCPTLARPAQRHRETELG